MLNAVASGRMAAESSEALINPMANSSEAYLPASGRSANAAWAAPVISCWPLLCRVAAQATTMKNATTSVMMQPMITSQRLSGYSFLPIPFSTMEACR